MIDVEIKTLRASELFTFAEWSKMFDIVKLSRLDGKPAAPDMVEQVIKPIISRIEAKVGAEISPMALALSVEQAMVSFLDGKGGMIVGEVPATAFPTGPVN